MNPVTVTFIHLSSGCIATIKPMMRFPSGEFSFDLTVNAPIEADPSLVRRFYDTWSAWISEAMTTKKEPSLPLGWRRQS